MSEPAQYTPAHSPNHVRCPACEAQRQSVMLSDDLSRQKLREAAPQWLESRKPYIAQRTYESYAYYLKAVTEFFGELALGDIHIGHLRTYQTKRGEPRDELTVMRGGSVRPRTWRANATTINHELNTLAQILKRAGFWKHLKDFYEPLPLPRWTPPRVLNAEEEDRLFRIAAQHAQWAVAYYASSLSVNTAAAGKEIRNLRLENLRLEPHQEAPLGLIFIPSDAVKNEHRARVVPLNERARAQVERLLERYFEICRKQGLAEQPNHYLIPFMSSTGWYDPTRPTAGWRKAWTKLRAAAGLPHFRMYDLRHQAITKMLENPEISEETIKSIAGHVSKNILTHYSHIRIAAKAKALGAIAPKHPVGSVSGKLKNVQALGKVRSFA